MERCGFVLLTVIMLISGASLGQSESGESSFTRKHTYTPTSPTYIDTGGWLAAPGLSAVLTEPNEISSDEEAMFATYSFSNAGTTYNIEFYYRRLYNRLRARVLVGDRELRGLFNRFYGIDATSRTDFRIYGRDGEPEVISNFGSFSLAESDLDTYAIYDLLEAVAGKLGLAATWDETFLGSPIVVYRPPGMLKKTCRAYVWEEYLVNDQGQIGLFTLKNLLIAYCQENIRAEQPEDFERIGRSLIEIHAKSNVFGYDVVTDVNDVGRLRRRLLESVNLAKIKPPAYHRDDDSQIDYWTCYAIVCEKFGPAILARYKFGFQNGLLCFGESVLLKEDSPRALITYQNLKTVRFEEEFILDQVREFEGGLTIDLAPQFKNGDSNSLPTSEEIPGPKKTVDGSPLLSVAGLRIVFVGAGVCLLALSYVVRRHNRTGSGVPKREDKDKSKSPQNQKDR